jgi:gamma-glutamyltranspeptidase/glutathione hydrolase
MYNGSMSGFDPRPGRAGSIAPGKARSSAMAPTIMFRDETPVIAIGAPGGTFIVPAIAQALSNVIDFGMSMAEAVAAPRIVCLSDTIDVSNRIERRVTAALEAKGYAINRSYQSFAFGAPHGIARSDELVGRRRSAARRHGDGRLSPTGRRRRSRAKNPVQGGRRWLSSMDCP